MTRPLRLLAYTDANEVGGAEISLGNLLATLDENIETSLLGVDADVLATIAARRPGTPLHVVPHVRNKWDLRPLARHVQAVRRLRPDVLHASLQTPWSGQYGILAGLLVPGVRVIAVEQSPLPSASAMQRRLKWLLSRRLAAHVAVGARAARDVEAFVGLPAYSVRTIYNGVPEVSFPPAPRRQANGLIGAVGRFDPQKGFDVLLTALGSLDGARARLIGDGPERDALEALMKELQLLERVELLGWREDARSLLPALDVFVLPSRHEAFPLAVVEAMLAGLPVVASDVGSVSEAVVHEETGLLVPPDDASALAEAIRRLLDDPSLRATFAENGRALALERFTASRMTRAFEELYMEVRR